MAINAEVQWECQSGGDDNNGGGFNSDASGTDYSQQTTAQATTTTATVVNATTTIIDVDAGDYTCTDADIGNIIQIYGGTATAAFYEITARSGQQWTVDRSCGTAGQTVVAKMGGCFATPGGMSFALNNGGVRGNRCWVKSATYTITNATGGTAGGPFKNDSVDRFQIEGYETTRGDRGTPPTLAAGSQTNAILWENTYFEGTYINLKADGQSQSGVNGFKTDYEPANHFLCEAVNCGAAVTNYGFSGLGKQTSCKAVDCGIGFAVSGQNCCIAIGCNKGYQPNVGSTHNCLAYDCVIGIDLFSVGTRAVNCTVDNCTTGMKTSSNYQFIANCIISNCTTAFDENTAVNGEDLQRVALYNNTSNGDIPSVTLFDYYIITLVNDPYNDRLNDDYRLNATAGGGAECVISLGVGGSNTTIGALPQVTSGGGGTVYSLHPLAYN